MLGKSTNLKILVRNIDITLSKSIIFFYNYSTSQKIDLITRILKHGNLNGKILE